MSFFDSPLSQSARQLYFLPTREGGFNVKEPIDYETEYAASLTACAPLEDDDRANARLAQERITHDQQTAHLKIIRSRKKDLNGNPSDRATPRNRNGFGKRSLELAQLHCLNVTVLH